MVLVATQLPAPDAVPQALLGLPNWLAWRSQERGGKLTKVPYSPRDGRHASTTDPATWTIFDQAAAYAERAHCDGVGFVFTGSPYAGIDLDHCVHPRTGKVDAWAREIVDRFASYTEFSPSRTGLHIIVRGKLPKGGRKQRVAIEGARPDAAIEVYDYGRYFTFTGNRFGELTRIADRSAILEAWLEETFPPALPEVEATPSTPVHVDDAELLELMLRSQHGEAISALWNGDTSGHGGDDSSADLALCNHLAFWTNRDAARIDRLFRASGLFRKKWERKDYRERTIAQAISGTPEGYSGPALEVDVSKEEPVKGKSKREVLRPHVAPVLIDAVTLWNQEFPEPRYAVPGLLPEGLCILAGRPKMGKSWLALGAAISVAKGAPVLGSIEVEQGGVLYMALEDGDRRLQRRLQELIPDDGPPPGLTFATQWPRFHEGREDLETWLDSHPNTRLVVIDTFKRVRPEDKPGGSVYGQDYEAIAPLSDLAHKRSVSIVVVMHTRKMDATDPIDLISGSLGLAGASDGALVMQRERGSADASLAVIDRDAEDKTLALRWNLATGGWLLLGDAEQYRRSRERNEMLAALHDFGPSKPKDIALKTGRPQGTVYRLLWGLAQAGLAINLGGEYRARAPRPDDIPSFLLGEGSEGSEGSDKAKGAKDE